MNRDSVSKRDALELQRFTIYLRAISQCMRAGVGKHEAAHAIAADLYGNKFADEPKDRGDEL